MTTPGTHLIKLTRNAYVELEALRHDNDWFNSPEIRCVEIDFAEVGVLDSMMVGHLVKLKLALKARTIDLKLENLGHSARLVLYHSNLGELFGIALAPPRWESETAS